MSLPEKHEYLYEAEGTFAIAARDKEWAEWILNNHNLWTFIQIITPEDFEALKKLAGRE